jgi:hypothetical protein
VPPAEAGAGGGAGALGAAGTLVARVAAPGGVGARSGAAKSSPIAPPFPIASTAPHTEHRARIPACGTLTGSTRNTDEHSGQLTFMSVSIG